VPCVKLSNVSIFGLAKKGAFLNYTYPSVNVNISLSGEDPKPPSVQLKELYHTYEAEVL